jgi:putative endopeptidase
VEGLACISQPRESRQLPSRCLRPGVFRFPREGSQRNSRTTAALATLPLQNALNFPAAILQPPFFDPQADAAHNYGAIGTVIGHEISHSFDDEGSQFDASGRPVNWWTIEDLKHFQAVGEALAAEFDAYHPFPDLAVNGHQTLSENIADLAGTRNGARTSGGRRRRVPAS